jgi:hypothetical protein
MSFEIKVCFKFALRPISLPIIVKISPTTNPLLGVVISTLVTAVSDVTIVALAPLVPSQPKMRY